jgi:hypothetical protein
MSSEKSVQYCPSCDHEILSKDINISEGVALCGECGNLSQLSLLNFTTSSIEEIMAEPPKSTKIKSGRDRVDIVLSLFSIPQFLGSLFVTLFWNGIVSVFVSLAAAAIYYHAVGPVPDWFPTPGLEEGKPIMNGEPMTVGMTIFFCLFLVPFVTIGSCMLANTLLRLFGSTKVSFTENKAHVSTGIWFFRWNNSFDQYDVKSIEYSSNYFGDEESSGELIEIMTTETTKFGRLLTEQQKEWIATLLRQLLIEKHNSKFLDKIPDLYWLNENKR